MSAVYPLIVSHMICAAHGVGSMENFTDDQLRSAVRWADRTGEDIPQAIRSELNRRNRSA